MLDHIPSLIQEIAGYLEDTDADEFAANTFVLDKARELGELRYEQRASVHQLLREYRVLAAILVTFVEQETTRLDSVAPIEVIAVLGRVAQAVGVLQQTTIETFIAKYTAQIDEQTRRLENFNRMVSHELRQPIGALQFAVKLADASDEDGRARGISGGDRAQSDAAGAADRPARDDVAAEDERRQRADPAPAARARRPRSGAAAARHGRSAGRGDPDRRRACRSSRSTSPRWS